MGEMLPQPQGNGKLRESKVGLGQDQDWMSGTKIRLWTLQPSKQAHYLREIPRVATARLAQKAKGVLWAQGTAARVCMMGRAHGLPTPYPHYAAVWAPAMVRDSSWEGLSMCPGRL